MQESLATIKQKSLCMPSFEDRSKNPITCQAKPVIGLPNTQTTPCAWQVLSNMKSCQKVGTCWDKVWLRLEFKCLPSIASSCEKRCMKGEQRSDSWTKALKCAREHWSKASFRSKHINRLKIFANLDPSTDSRCLHICNGFIYQILPYIETRRVRFLSKIPSGPPVVCTRLFGPFSWSQRLG